MMGEVGARAPARMGEADPLVEHPGVAAHPWVAFVYLSWGQLEELEKRSELQGPWSKLRDPGRSLQPEALQSPSHQSIRPVVLSDEGRPSTSGSQLVAPPSWRCSRQRY